MNVRRLCCGMLAAILIAAAARAADPAAPAGDVATLRALSDTCDHCHTAPVSR